MQVTGEDLVLCQFHRGTAGDSGEWWGWWEMMGVGDSGGQWGMVEDSRERWGMAGVVGESGDNGGHQGMVGDSRG